MLNERHSDGVTWLTFDRAQRLNSFTANDYRDLRVAIDRLGADSVTRVIVMTGHGRAFSAGADRSLFEGSDTDRQHAGQEFDRLLQALVSLDKPLLAAVNGMAVGFGATLLLYCDVVLMAENARLRLPFTSLGMVPEAGSSALLPKRMSWPDAIWYTLSSEWISATTALRAGLVWRVVAEPDLISETSSAAATLSALDPKAVRATKRVMTAGRAQLINDATSREVAAMAELMGSVAVPTTITAPGSARHEDFE
jgi:enoyl-CoA hydratase/carnithine racemase